MFNKVIIFPTMRCSLSCPSCLRRKSVIDTHFTDIDMTWDEFCNALESLKRQASHLRSITISGGEPTLWPYLKEAIAKIKKETSFEVRVCSNAVKRTAEDYGDSDVVFITNYGAINRYYIWHIKKHFKGKVIIQNAIHIPYPFPGYTPSNKVLPANCTCLAGSIVRDRVYSCGIRSGFDSSPYKSLDSNWLQEFRDEGESLLMDKLCTTCLVNRNIRSDYTIPMTFEACLWDINSIMFSVKGKFLFLRKVYRFFMKKKRGF